MKTKQNVSTRKSLFWSSLSLQGEKVTTTKLQYYKFKYLSCIKLPLNLAITSLLWLRSKDHKAPGKKLLLQIVK